MKTFHMNASFILYCVYFIYYVITAPQQPEINDQFENITTSTPSPNAIPSNAIKLPENDTILPADNEILVPPIPAPINASGSRRVSGMILAAPEMSITTRICDILKKPFVAFASTPKVNSVLRNIGTCIVNGAMEIVTYYFPAPLIPLIATAAGMVIPFEPVVMLREKMPVTSYRRAFRTALNSFLSTFDRYRLDDEEEDPYMTRRFNRRVMNYDSDKKKN